MNEIQNGVLETISVCRNEIEHLFENYSNRDCLIDHTLKRLFAYQSDRSQTISYLVSSNYWWDAEILMRPFYETHSKIWFICQTKDSERQGLVEEFWGALGDIHARQKADRASTGAAQLSKADSQEAIILQLLSDEHLFPTHKASRSERKRIESKWSFSEIITALERNSDSAFPLAGISALRHMYGQQSHLIHGDESALNLMLDRQLRSKEELELLICSHVCRIFGDQVSLWAFSTSALRHRYSIADELTSPRWMQWKKVVSLIEPFTKRFNENQRDFYAQWSKRNDSE